MSDLIHKIKSKLALDEHDEVPENGWKGLKHIRYDAPAGFIVSLISLPFSMAIGLSSGATAIAGLLSAIISGFVMPLMGGRTSVTVSGPAAGLSAALAFFALNLGDGKNTASGYKQLLACIVVIGAIQLLMAWKKLARWGQLIPMGVIHGMLAAIGAGIIVKSLPDVMGMKFEHKGSFWPMLLEAVQEVYHGLPHCNRNVLVISSVSLTFIFGIGYGLEKKWKYSSLVAPIAGAAIGMILSYVLAIDATFRVNLPDVMSDPRSALLFPDFPGLVTGGIGHFAVVLGTIFALNAIDVTEVLATLAGIDSNDAYSRRSDANRSLKFIGICNGISGLLGGLTNIPGVIKSTAANVAGARTLWSNTWNAIFLSLYISVGYRVIMIMPLAALGCVVILMGFKLCRLKVWKHIAEIGRDQLFIFSVTFFVTITEDLLWGIAAGGIAKFLMIIFMAKRTEGGRKLSLFQIVRQLRHNPVKEVDAGVTYKVDGDYEILLDNSTVTCFNSVNLQSALEKIPHDYPNLLVIVRFSENLLLIDHTSMCNLYSFKHYFESSGRGTVQLELDSSKMKCMSLHPKSMRTPIPSNDYSRNRDDKAAE